MNTETLDQAETRQPENPFIGDLGEALRTLESEDALVVRQALKTVQSNYDAVQGLHDLKQKTDCLTPIEYKFLTGCLLLRQHAGTLFGLLSAKAQDLFATLTQRERQPFRARLGKAANDTEYKKAA